MYLVGRTKLGYTEKEIDQMYLGRLIDVLNIWSEQFEQKEQEKEVASLEDL